MRRLLRGVPAVILFMALVGTAEARDYYGAIAYSKMTRAQGYVYDEDSQEDAESAALTSCSDLAADCEPVAWFRNACGALAVSSEGAWGSAWGEDEGTAEKKALDGCGQYAKDCQIVRWVCTTR
jgi:serine/threonine-protein kinase